MRIHYHYDSREREYAQGIQQEAERIQQRLCAALQQELEAYQRMVDGMRGGIQVNILHALACMSDVVGDATFEARQQAEEVINRSEPERY